MKEEMNQNRLDVTPSALPTEPKLMNMSRVEIFTDSLQKNGYDVNNLPKGLEKVMRDLEKEDRMDDAVTLSQRTGKIKEYKGVKERLKVLQDEIKHETSIAKLNGYNERDAEKINKLSDKIVKTIELVQQKKDEVPSFASSVMASLRERSQSVKDEIKSGFEKVKAGLDMKISAGFTALSKIKDTVKDENVKFYASKDTAYTHLAENVFQIGRDLMSVTYGIDKTLLTVLERQKERMEKAYDHQAELKGAIKDLGRAFIGKERMNEKAPYTKEQKMLLHSTNQEIAFYRREMQNLEKSYAASKEASTINLMGAQKHREAAGINFSDTLQEQIQKVISKDIGKKNIAETKQTKAPMENIR